LSRLIKNNTLAVGEDGVYSHPTSAEKDFAYSDGSEAEKYLFSVFSECEDLGSHSEELQLKIKDWPSEYHLSGKRANLFRAFELPAGAKALELGCGCGSITRYLGEQALQVEAIEGSRIRASLARQRCRDLSNVDIIQANFNSIELPDEEYDLVFLIGVTEYARLFSPKSTSDRGAVVDLLKRVSKSLKPGGQVIVAIENRTGMKYLHGAHEDHYSLRYVGIDNYDDSAGIRTYTQDEWRQISKDCQFEHQSFFYPFPDYKIPTVLLGESYITKDKNAWCHLEGIHSDDYIFLFDPYIPESLSWQTYNAAGVLGDMANSFLIVMSKQTEVGTFTNLDFAHLPDFRRKREFCTVITKNSNEQNVSRQPLAKTGKNNTSDEPFHYGQLLSARWARTLIIYNDAHRFLTLIQTYIAFLKNHHLQHGQIPIDLLPNNIVVSSSGNYQIFDQEWSENNNNSSEFMLFRALLIFTNHYRPAIRQFCRNQNILDVESFLRYCFQGLGFDRQQFTDFCILEDTFQNRVLLGRDANTQSVLTTPLIESPVKALVDTRLYWNKTENGFTDKNSVGLSIAIEDSKQILSYTFTPSTSKLESFRFDPCDQNKPNSVGFFHIDSIRVLVNQNPGSEPKEMWSLDGQSLILNKSQVKQISRPDSNGWLAVTGDDPALIFEPNLALDNPSQNIRIEVTLEYATNLDYQMARCAFIDRETALLNKLNDLEVRLSRAKRAERDLHAIRQSRSWRLLTKIRSAFMKK
jgi:SAM-dependent methyltransferase